jgi:hypothetical protein
MLLRVPILRPLVRVLVGVIALRVFRWFLRHVLRLQNLNAELEKDLEQWFRCSLVLLVSTRFMEAEFFFWFDQLVTDVLKQDSGSFDPVVTGFRILLAIGVIEAMPDQELFAIVHPGPPKLQYTRKRGIWEQLREQARPYLKGLLCQHLNRSSPVFAILAAVFPGGTGVFCYSVAIAQYLIIGLVTSRDLALDVLGEFDRQVAIRRREIIDEFEIDDARRDEPPPGQKIASADDSGEGAAAND